MRILFLSPYYGSRVASSYLGKNRNQAFADAGFEMIAYAPTPSRGLSEETIRHYRTIKKETNYDGKQVVHLFWMFKEGKNPVGRALRYTLTAIIHFLKGSFAKDAKTCNIMFILSTPPIQGAMAALVKKVRHIPLIYNLQDIFPDSLVGTGLAKKGGLLWKIGRVIENFTYRNADKIIVISEDFKRNIMAKGVPEEKIEVIYNWVDEEAVVDVPRAENKLFDKYGLDRDQFYVTYNGNIGLTQNMDMLLEVARELQQSCGSDAATQQLGMVKNGSDAALQQLAAVKNGLNNPNLSEPLQTPHNPSEPLQTPHNPSEPLQTPHNPSEPLQTPHHRSIHFVLVGEGAYKAEVERRIKEQGITNVTMLPFQPYEDISHVFSLGDVSLVISKPGVGANSVPSKTWSIMSASRPVLANFDENELKTIIADHHCGIFTKAGDKEAFKAAILELYHHPELCREYGKNGRQFVMDNLTKEVGTRKYVEVVKAVAEHSSSKS